jgi:hypothetical protein
MKTAIKQFVNAKLKQMSPAFVHRAVFVAALAMLFIVFLLDIVTPSQISLRPFYAIPVLLAATNSDSLRRDSVTIFVAALLFAASSHIKNPTQGPLHILINFFVALAAYALVWLFALVAGYIKFLD